MTFFLLESLKVDEEQTNQNVFLPQKCLYSVQFRHIWVMILFFIRLCNIRKVTERLFTQEHKVHVQVHINSPWFGMVHLWSGTSGTWTRTGCSARRVIQPLSTDRTVTVTFALSIKQCHISQRPRLQTLGWPGNSNTWIFEQILQRWAL